LADALEARGWREAPLSAAERTLCAWAEKLTLTPGAMTRADADGLRAAGWSDEQVVAAAMVVGYFNLMNRIADGLGVDPEPA
jgi:uncharacterized peroxidase-related enzyme